MLVGSLVLAAVVGYADHGSIIGGTEAEPCAWPNVVHLEGLAGEFLCSATLVHPLVVVTAGHCLFGSAPVAAIGFGEGPEFAPVAAIEFCEAGPEFVNGPDGSVFDNTDFAFCKLREPIENVPIIPIAYGCELDALVVGSPVAEVGFGSDINGVQNIKRFVEAEVIAFEPDGEIHVDGGTCFGDSGGPTLMQLADGTWRQVGIHSYVSDSSCLGDNHSSAAWQVLPFIEERTGIDVTPCHDADGGWDPSWACQAIPRMPYAGGDGDYEQGCPAGPVSGFVDTCGDPLDAKPDETAPTVAFVRPHDGDRIEGEGGNGMLEVEVSADDPGEWGVASVELVVEAADGGQNKDLLKYAPYAWRLQLPVGAYYMQAVAIDHAEHDGETEWIAIGIGVAPPPPRPEDPVETDTDTDSDGSSSGESSSSSGSSSSTGEDSGGSEETGAPVMQAESDGCGCRAGSRSPLGLACLLVLAARIRRRRADLG